MKYLIILFLIFNISCNHQYEDPYFPSEIKSIEVHHISLYKGFITVNDTLTFDGGYYKYGPFDESMLYGHLLVGDKVLNSGNPKKYIDVIKNKSNDTIRYYTYTGLKDKK